MTNRAAKIDFVDALPLMHSANFDELNNRSFIEKLRDWTCILIACIIMVRPSEICEYCPVVESSEIPIERKDWSDDFIL